MLDVDQDIETSAFLPQESYSIGNPQSIANTTSITYISFTSPFLSEPAKQLVNKIKGFRILEKNWDSYGAVPPTPPVIEEAIRFVKKADTNLLPFYFTSPGPNGELLIEFRKGNREAAAYFNPDGPTELILTENNQITLEGSLEENYRDLLLFINT